MSGRGKQRNPQQQKGSGNGKQGDRRRESSPREGRSDSSQSRGKQWTRPKSSYTAQIPTGTWVDPYTGRRCKSRAFDQASQEEIDGIVERLRKPTEASTGAPDKRDKEYVYTEPPVTKTNPRIQRKKPQPRTEEERDDIANRLFTAKTQAWVSRRAKNPNTRVHYSSDFTII